VRNAHQLAVFDIESTTNATIKYKVVRYFQ